MTAISPIRFFVIAPLHSPYLLLALAAVGLAGIVMLIAEPSKGAGALGPLALIQMFAASSGFAVAARRGHFDLLLTAGSGRVAVALTHLGASVLPGVVVWVTLGLVEMLVAQTMMPLAFASGTVFAFGVISLLAWALTVRLPRLSGGIAWLLGIAVWMVEWTDGATAVATLDQAAGGYLPRAVVVVLCPFLLIGKRLSGDEWLVALPAVGLAACLAGSAVIWIARTDVPLESAQ